MAQLYDPGIAQAVKRAGYRVTRSGLEDHLDKILGDIRRGPFLVAISLGIVMESISSPGSHGVWASP